MKKIIVLTGQTATGKTNLALKLASKYNGELINCDSRQVYKYLDIITGKDIKKSRYVVQESWSSFDIGYYPINYSKDQIIPLWLCDIVDPKRYFSPFDFANCAQRVIDLIIKKNKTPIIVGGSYFYIYNLLYQLSSHDIKPDLKLRKLLNKKKVGELQGILKKYSINIFKSLNNSDVQNPQRLIRKIEIAKKKPEFNEKPMGFNIKPRFKNIDFEMIGLKFKDKDTLQKTIKERVEERIKNHAFQEVLSLLNRGYTKSDPGLKTIGYKQLIDYLDKKISKKQAIEQWITKEVQYSKRQLTFMKRDKNIRWLHPTSQVI